MNAWVLVFSGIALFSSGYALGSWRTGRLFGYSLGNDAGPRDE